MPPAAIETTFLRDTRHGGAPGQPRAVADAFADFVAAATTSIDLAVYDLRLADQALVRPIVDSLLAAAARGIVVRLAYDAGKPATGTAHTFAMLAADPAPPGTATWVQEHFAGTSVQTKAIRASGQLMHSKYCVVDGKHGGAAAAVWTGSANFTDDAWTFQESVILTVRSTGLAAAYRRDFDEMWSTGSIVGTGKSDRRSVSVGATKIVLDFSPGDGPAIDAALVAAINGSHQRIVLATMVLTSHPVLAALVAAIERGVPVSGIYDSGQMGPIAHQWQLTGHSQDVLAHWDVVRAHLADKRSTPYAPDSLHDFMHNKTMILDDTVFTGSYNFSANAQKNAENILALSGDSALVARFAAYIADISAAYAHHGATQRVIELDSGPTYELDSDVVGEGVGSGSLDV